MMKVNILIIILIIRDSFCWNYSNQLNNNNVIKAAVVSKHRVLFVDSTSMDNSKPVMIQVPARSIPLTLILRSASSDLKIIQRHENSDGAIHEETSSIDEPHRLIHTVKKPIIQEIFEIITPYRFVEQKIEPIKEIIHTIISKQQTTNNSKTIEYHQQNDNVRYLMDNNYFNDYNQQQQQQQQESKQQQQIWHLEMRNQLQQQYLKAINDGLLTNLYGIPVL